MRNSYAFVADWNDRPPAERSSVPDYRRRALGIWPGLDRVRLGRTKGDPWKIARLVSHRTSLTFDDILVMLMGVNEGRAGGLRLVPSPVATRPGAGVHRGSHV